MTKNIKKINLKKKSVRMKINCVCAILIKFFEEKKNRKAKNCKMYKKNKFSIQCINIFKLYRLNVITIIFMKN